MFYEANRFRRQGICSTKPGGFENAKGFRSTRYEDEKVFGDEGFSEAKMFLKMYSKTTWAVELSM